ncbi:MAG: response regulator transcription factor [Dehalococcoidia bacterium]|nr:response regulator transcription factor [Dehalococcoidia bacterium]
MKVLLIEDRQEIINTLSLTFKLRWPEATLLSTPEGAKGIEMAESESPDIIILDINLPDMEGFEVLEQIRLFSDVPIIILTVREAELDKVRGLEMGADDYVVKPFSAIDLLARVRAVLRRVGVRHPEDEELPPFTAGDLTINFLTREVLLRGEPVHLTPTEYKLLHYLVRNQGRVATHEALRQHVWGSAEYVDPSTVKKNIHQLRSKLGDAVAQMIISERGVGYKFAKPR